MPANDGRNDQRLTICLPPTLYRRLVLMADKVGTSKSAIIREALEYYSDDWLSERIRDIEEVAG